MTVYPFFRALLFRLDPELAHQITLRLIRLAGDISPVNGMLRQVFSASQRPVQAFGLTFSNPIGLAAGYDKDGLGWRGLACLGFGHIEVGTVTPIPQTGNPKPRLFRLIADEALINRMGFPSGGAEAVIKQLSKPKPKNLILGVNIGKNKDTPLETAVDDYRRLLRLFAPIVDYLTINVSSPNTVGLRRLQERQALHPLLQSLAAERELQATAIKGKPPLLVKLAPDLSDEELDDALDVICLNQMDGIVATNTTISRPMVSSPLGNETGGLSGKPLFSLSLNMVEKINKRTHGKMPVIGVGGINNATSVRMMLDAGAVLVQIYTGLIFEGPGLVKRILGDLTE